MSRMVRVEKSARLVGRHLLTFLVYVLSFVLAGNFLTTPNSGRQVVEAQTSCCTVTVPGTANPWLAGMPNGSTAAMGDSAPAQSPVLVNCISITPGQLISVTVTGQVSNGPCCSPVGPDGTPGGVSHIPGAENGIANVAARINALMGVFLGPDRPDTTPAPAGLDFTTDSSQNYTTLSPLLKQVFFLGDGRNSQGTVQKVVVPAGATRLFLGPMDGIEWNNNTGSFSAQVCTEPATPPPANCANLTVPGTSNPWLAGMPNGSTAAMGDSAPAQSPRLVPTLSISGGDIFTFDPVTGAVSNGPCCAPIAADGGAVEPHIPGAENGVSNLTAPINALLGVFLGPDPPNTTPAPAGLDFSSAASRNFTTLSPQLKQVFFIGDGRNGSNVVQQFVAPAGATRLFLGTMDGIEWNNNTGSFSVLVCEQQPPQSCTPPPPTPATVCLQDDTDGIGNGNRIQFNTATGAYFFTNCVGLIVQGTGQVSRSGNSVILIDERADRKVIVENDICTRTGFATIRLVNPEQLFTVTDSNTANSNCSCQ